LARRTESVKSEAESIRVSLPINDYNLRTSRRNKMEYKNKQDCQALLTAKYCPQVTAVASAGSNKVAPPIE